MKIALLAHWHTASTLLAKQFEMCGMEVGNLNTYWTPKTCDPQCEHALLNGLGDSFLLGKRSSGDVAEVAGRVFQSYIDEAEKNNWNHFGVKLTHGVQGKAWPLFRMLFENYWGNPYFVTIVRSIDGIVNSTHDSKWDRSRIESSWQSCKESIADIMKMKNGVVFFYPYDWDSGNIVRKFAHMGINLTVKAEMLYDPKRKKESNE